MGNRLQDLRLDLAARSQWNIGYFYAGLAFWLYAAVVGWVFPLQIAKIYWLIGTSFIFPMAILASRLLGADPFSKGNPLGEIVGYTHLSVLGMTLPIVLIAAVQYPELMILVMAIAYSLDFFLMGWAFGSRLFGIHATVRTVMVSGTGTRAAIPGYDLAGKTGTTSDYKDAWFCGFTGGLASCAWLGRDDARSMGRVSGATIPAEMWKSFMVTALKRAPRQPIPPGPLPPVALPAEEPEVPATLPPTQAPAN